MVLIFTGRDISLGVTERAKQELCCYIRRRLAPAPSGAKVTAVYYGIPDILLRFC
jgi:hypothetical protein